MYYCKELCVPHDIIKRKLILLPYKTLAAVCVCKIVIAGIMFQKGHLLVDDNYLFLVQYSYIQLLREHQNEVYLILL